MPKYEQKRRGKMGTGRQHGAVATYLAECRKRPGGACDDCKNAWRLYGADRRQLERQRRTA